MRRRRPPAATLTLTADPVLRAGTTAQVVAEIEGGEGTLRVFLRLLGWDMRVPQRWLLAEQPAGAGTHALAVEIPRDLPPGCARLTEYAIFADLAGQRVAAAAPVRLASDQVFALDGPASAGDPIELDHDTVVRGGTVSGRATADAVEIGAELHTLVETTAPRFQAAATVTPGPGGGFSATLPPDVPPTLHDGEELAVVWVVRAGDAWQRFAVVDPEGEAGERRPPLLTFLAQLSRDSYL